MNYRFCGIATQVRVPVTKALVWFHVTGYEIYGPGPCYVSFFCSINIIVCADFATQVCVPTTMSLVWFNVVGYEIYGPDPWYFSFFVQ